ncbi:hypothetical protein [Kutzneria sp. CA-103260]|uniref:hypothetical protein n=1 Tax=Kutzneria sp. CA-103260 TaxID=2802641 RepID=UPI001BAD4CB6|nr:hypothetical protein [Kutzneria sp. CA-103260]QUQ67184.1 hypothetical protein JJ691_49170 [Kutzneria sp. CA-103260]
MNAPTPADLHRGQPVRVTGRGHLSRCGTIAFFVGDDASSAAEVWVDFGGGAVLSVERCMIEPVAPADDVRVADPVAAGLEALRTSWPEQRLSQPGTSDG